MSKKKGARINKKLWEKIAATAESLGLDSKNSKDMVKFFEVISKEK